MKNILKTIYRHSLGIPVIGRVCRVIVGILRIPQMNMQIAALQARLAVVPGPPVVQVNGDRTWERHAPAFLNAVSSVGAFGHDLQRQSALLDELSRRVQSVEARAGEPVAARGEAASRDIGDLQQIAAQHWSSIGELWQRLEFVRKEMLFEISLGTATEDKDLPEPKVLNPDRLKKLTESGIRVNMGCGHIPFDDYVNVDTRELPGVDVQARLDKMPFEPGSVTEIFSAHVLEHFSQEELQRRLLPYWHSLLAPGGVIRAIVPDGLAITTAMAKGEMSFEDYREVTYGGQEYQGDFHFNMFSPDSLKETLEKTGFAEPVLVAAGRRNGKCFELEISARKI